MDKLEKVKEALDIGYQAAGYSMGVEEVRFIDEALAELNEYMGNRGWQPIETYDGPEGFCYPVLVTWDGYVTMAYKESDKRRKKNWASVLFGNDGDRVRMDPTHWMPLPELPEEV